MENKGPAAQSPPPLPQPKWQNASVWLGSDLFALLRLLARGGFRVRPGKLPDCLVDLWFGAFNTAMGALQAFRYGPALAKIELRDDPIFIIGHWRTGTTLLHELLALDPRHRCPTTYECFAPTHFLLSEPLITGWTGFLLPGSRPTDAMKMGWDLPQEEEFALCLLGVPSPYATLAFPNRPPLFSEYLDLENMSETARRQWKRALAGFLKQLVYKRAGRLVLKSPPHTCRIPTLLEMFPRACFINLVRNPYAIFTSTLRLWKVLYGWLGYQKAHLRGVEEQIFRTFSHMHERLKATRGLVNPARICDLRYEDLVREPLGQMRAVYEHLDLGPFAAVEPAIRQYFADRADYQANRQELPPELRATIWRRWRAYFERYGYSME